MAVAAIIATAPCAGVSTPLEDPPPEEGHAFCQVEGFHGKSLRNADDKGRYGSDGVDELAIHVIASVWQVYRAGIGGMCRKCQYQGGCIVSMGSLPGSPVASRLVALQPPRADQASESKRCQDDRGPPEEAMAA